MHCKPALVPFILEHILTFLHTDLETHNLILILTQNLQIFILFIPVQNTCRLQKQWRWIHIMMEHGAWIYHRKLYYSDA